MEREEKMNMAFTQQDIERHLQSALAASTPDIWPKLEAALKTGGLTAEALPDQKPAFQGFLGELPKTKAKAAGFKKLQKLGAAMAACLCLAVAGGSYYHYAYLQVASQVEIDVNPSLRLFINRKERVIKAQALNEDGEGLINGSSLKGQTVQAAVNQVVDSLVEKGYLERESGEHAVLVSVSGTDTKAAEQIKTAVTADMEAALAQNEVNAVVFDQVIQITEELEELAETYQVSLGKAEFIGQLVQENVPLNENQQDSYSRMMGQTMEELTQEIDQNSYQIGSGVTVIKTDPIASTKRSDAENDRNQDLEGGNSSQTLPKWWNDPDKEMDLKKEEQEEAKPETELSGKKSQRDGSENPADGKDPADNKGTNAHTNSVKSEKPADGQEPEESKKTADGRGREQEDNRRLADTEAPTENKQPETDREPESDGSSIGSKSTAGDEKAAGNGADAKKDSEEEVENSSLGSKPNQDSENPDEPVVQAQGELEEINVPAGQPPSKVEEGTGAQPEPETGDVPEELNPGNDSEGLGTETAPEGSEPGGVSEELGSGNVTKEMEGKDGETDSRQEESQAEPDSIDGNSSAPKEETIEETIEETDSALDEEIPTERDGLPEEETVGESEAILPEEKETFPQEETAGKSESILPEEREVSPEKETTGETGASFGEQTLKQEQPLPDKETLQQEQQEPPSKKDEVLKEDLPLLTGSQKKRFDSDGSSDKGETDLPEKEADNRIIRTPSEEIDTFEPGDMAGERQEGLTTTSNGTTIIFEAVEEKKWREPVYASQLLTGSERSLLQMGPGIFSGLISTENQELLLQLGPGFLYLYGDSMMDLEEAYFLGIRIMPLQGRIYPMGKIGK